MRKYSEKQSYVDRSSTAVAVPPRASARSARFVTPVPRSLEAYPLPKRGEDITRIPTIPKRDIASRVRYELSMQNTLEHASVIYTQYMDVAKNGSLPHKILFRNPLERIRWWLLYPGRLEFLLLAGGTLLLLGITTLFVLIVVLSANIFN